MFFCMGMCCCQKLVHVEGVEAVVNALLSILCRLLLLL